MMQISRFFVLLVLPLLIGSCRPAQDNEAVPDNLLRKEKFQQVLVDIMIADAYVQELPIPMDSQKMVLNKTYSQIFERHKVKREAYLKTLSYYNAHPAEFNELMEPIKDTLSAMEAERAE